MTPEESFLNLENGLKILLKKEAVSSNIEVRDIALFKIYKGKCIHDTPLKMLYLMVA